MGWGREREQLLGSNSQQIYEVTSDGLGLRTAKQYVGFSFKVRPWEVNSVGRFVGDSSDQVAVVHGEIAEHRRSSYQAHLANVYSMAQVIFVECLHLRSP